MLQVSETTKKIYDDSNCVFFKNYVQAAHYLEWGAELVDLFTTQDFKLVFVFSKADHEKYKMRWGSSKREANDG